jgi:hypothetical protein
MTTDTEYKNPTSMHVLGLSVHDRADRREGCAHMEVNGLLHKVQLRFFYQQGHIFFDGVKDVSAKTPFANDDGSVDYLWVRLVWQKVLDLESALLAINHLFAPACFDPDGPTDHPPGHFGHPR